MRKFSLRHLGVVLGAFALATILWGCSNMAPTGVNPNDPSLQPQAPSTVHTYGDPDRWW